MGESDVRADAGGTPVFGSTGAMGTDEVGRWVIRASRVRARVLFVLLDSIAIVAGYGLAEVINLRDRAPAHYWTHLALFLPVALMVQLVAFHVFGLYGRMWRHAGIEEARQILLSSLTVSRRPPDPLPPGVGRRLHEGAARASSSWAAPS